MRKIMLIAAGTLALANSAQADCFAYWDWKFGGDVLEVASGSCVVMADESVPTDKCEGMNIIRAPAWANKISSIRTTEGSSYGYFLGVSGMVAGGGGEVSDTQELREEYVGDDLNDRIQVFYCN